MNNPPHGTRLRAHHMAQAALQCAAAMIVLGVFFLTNHSHQEAMPWFRVSILVGSTALIFATLMRQVWWWRIIHALFAPAIYIFTKLPIDPVWYLLTSTTLFLIYRGALTGRVPLYFSNVQTANALVLFFAETPPNRIIDLGAGIGSVACPLAKALPETEITGFENALIPWLIGRMRTARMKNCRWLLSNLWHASLSEYDVVYAFLSPEPMPALWEKIRKEMRPGSLFISNSFPVPEHVATFVIDVNDRRKTRLFCYRI